MKDIVEILLKKKIICKKLVQIDNKDLKTRKKIRVFEGVDLKSYYLAIFYIEQKSRFLRKNVEEIEVLYEKLKIVRDHNFKKKIFIHKSPLCSLAKDKLKELKWKVISDLA